MECTVTWCSSGAAGDTAANNDAARNFAAGEANAVAKTSAAAAT